MNKWLTVWLLALAAITAVQTYAQNCDGGNGRWYPSYTQCYAHSQYCGFGEDCRVDYCEWGFCSDEIRFCIANYACNDPYWNGCWQWTNCAYA